MEKQGMTSEEIARAYDAGYTNAIMQLRNHINAFVDKPNSQIKKVFDLMDTMLELAEESHK
jgi:hypothetical protein